MHLTFIESPKTVFLAVLCLVDPHHFDADRMRIRIRPTTRMLIRILNLYADPDFYLMRIRSRSRLFTLMRIHSFWLAICKLMRIRFRATLRRIRIRIFI